jgi:GNAT superfamily N-acetyltransferase
MHLSFIAARAIQLQITIINLFCRDEDLKIYQKFYPDEEKLRKRLFAQRFFQNLFDRAPTNKDSYINQVESLLTRVALPIRPARIGLHEYLCSENTNIVCIFDFEKAEKIRAVITYEVEENYLHISALAVDPSYRRCGFGTLLLLCAINHASLLGKKHVELFNRSHYSPLWKLAYKDSRPEQTFYQKLGFKPDVFGSDLRLNLADPIVNTLFREKGLVRRNSFSSFQSLKHPKYEEKRGLHFFRKEAPFLPIF